MSEQGYKDISTVISILPYRLNLNATTVFPSDYVLEANENDKFTYAHITRARTDRYLGGPTNNGVVSIPILSEEIADSFVKDHIRASVCVVPGFAEPGIFYLPEKVDAPLILINSKLMEVRAKQKQWYIKLVEQAESDYKRTGNVRAVGLLARIAARRLSLQYEWTTEENVRQEEINKCPVCTSIVNPNAVVCMTCKYVLDRKRYEIIKNDFATSER